MLVGLKYQYITQKVHTLRAQNHLIYLVFWQTLPTSSAGHGKRSWVNSPINAGQSWKLHNQSPSADACTCAPIVDPREQSTQCITLPAYLLTVSLSLCPLNPDQGIEIIV